MDQPDPRKVDCLVDPEGDSLWKGVQGDRGDQQAEPIVGGGPEEGSRGQGERSYEAEGEEVPHLLQNTKHS